jgi:hypothetical protein
MQDMTSKPLKKLQLLKAIVGKRGVQWSHDRVCGRPECNRICKIIPTGNGYNFDVECEEHGNSATISWNSQLLKPNYIRKD